MRKTQSRDAFKPIARERNYLTEDTTKPKQIPPERAERVLQEQIVVEKSSSELCYMISSLNFTEPNVTSKKL